MLIDPISSVDDRDPKGGRHRVNGTGIAVPKHHTIAVVVEHMGDIFEGLALGDPCGGPVGDVDGGTAEAMPGTVKRQPRARAWFVKGVDQNLAGERRVVTAIAIWIALKFRRQPKHLQQNLGAKRLDRHHVLIHQILQRLNVFGNGSQQLLGLVLPVDIGPHRLKPNLNRRRVHNCCFGLCHSGIGSTLCLPNRVLKPGTTSFTGNNNHTAASTKKQLLKQRSGKNVQIATDP